MHVRAITWAGTRTEKSAEMVDFLERRLGLARDHEEPGVTTLSLPNGDTVEVFDAADPEHQHFSTGPVIGFLVDDVEDGRRELDSAGLELLGPVMRGGGMVWQHFRAPDGNVWEITGRDTT
jgi:catechol 2,3-dioxygenase-like lactoylglutathione lyase family enzyme